MSKRRPDLFLIILVLVLLVFGIFALTSATMAIGLRNFQDQYYFAKHQIFYGIIPGLILLFICSQIPYHWWKKIGVLLFLLSIILLLLVFIPQLGVSFGKTKSWIQILNLSFQPAEIAKLGFLIYLAAGLEKFLRLGKKPTSSLVFFLLTLLLVAVPLIFQPDIGTLTILVVIGFIVYFLSNAPLLYCAGLSAAAIGALSLIVKIAPYRSARLITFLQPELDPQGLGYHINQALLAIGSGGFFGLGFGHSQQKFQYLPEVASDSIFAIIAEEMGFIITFLFLLIFALLLWRILLISKKAPDTFSHLFAAGAVAWFGFQAFFNIGAMLNLLPLTGLPLPFIGYGGTAMATSLATIGILLNISRHRLS